MKKGLTVVIKLGTSSIVDEHTHQPLLSILSLIVETAVNLRKDGYHVVIVSSGAIGTALRMMDLDRRPKHLPKVQALAAIGQCRLMSLWDQLFSHFRQPVAQILLTRNDIADRTQYLNAQNTFIELLSMGVIPIVNENDTLSVQEIKFGDNDTLSAITAGMVQADYLFLMTDVDCLYDTNPRKNPDAKPIEVVEDIGTLTADTSSAGSSLGTGGMSTKIVAARLATSAGVMTVITKSSKPGNIRSIVRYVEASKVTISSSLVSPTPPQQHQPEIQSEVPLPIRQDAQTAQPTTSTAISPSPSSSQTLPPQPPAQTLQHPPLHTRFLPSPHPIRDRYFWLLHGLAPHGTIYIDSGAHRALADKAGLLPAGVVDVEGNFAQHEAVRIVVIAKKVAVVGNAVTSSPTNGAGKDGSGNGSGSGTTTPAPVEVGRALVNYSAAEIRRIKGHRSTEIHDVLGYADSEYVALRENIAFLALGSSRPGTPGI
ncbi:putative glutamate 5-kinase [Aulographum hederae CBS 113979]|uniref:Putative glutamate 5-kinase n=1 Tax=Aulographum hederae CBS 113979 TaxID=1176131 RepID=A0A6G1H365_9PEZI|nr:putative glutamate 5-kinase [Aulographum hederae CBS 113979]